MLVHTRTRSLVLNLKDPSRVMKSLPHARILNVRGQEVVALPHKEDEVRVLRNLGIDAPAPAAHYYDYPGHYKPFAHQRATVEFLSINPRAYVTSGLGSGKTLCGLWAYDYLRGVGRVNKLLIISPLSTLERAWGDEILRNFPDLSYAVLHGSADKRLKLLADTRHDVYILNHDGLRGNDLHEALCQRDDIDCIIVDELACFRNASSERWKRLNTLINGRRIKGTPDPAYPMRQYAWGFTGTPIPNSPMDAWAQCRIINPARTPPFVTRFRDEVMTQITQFKWVPKPKALEVVQKTMQPAIRFSREECIDLPPTTHITRHAELTPQQSKAYDAMFKHMHVELEGGELTAVNEAVKLGRLLQICTGASYTVDGGTVSLPFKPRLDATLEVIDEAEAKVIVFVPYTAALHAVAEAIGQHRTVAVVNGATPKTERDRIFRDFQHAQDPQVLVANPAAVSHGLTLTAADTIVWFAPVYSNEIWEQANGRIARPGQTRNTRVVSIEGSPVERRVYERLRTKGQMQGVLLTLLKEAR